MAAVGTWPGYGGAAHAAGAGAIFVCPLQVGAARFGLLTLFAEKRRELTHDELERCLGFASLATELLIDGPGAKGGRPSRPGPGGRPGPSHRGVPGAGDGDGPAGHTLNAALARMRATAFSRGVDLGQLSADIVAGRARLTDDEGGLVMTRPQEHERREVRSVILTNKLADAFVEVADTLVDDFDVVDFLETTEHAVAVSGAAAAGLLLSDHDDRLQFMAATDEDSRSLELYQLQKPRVPAWTPSAWASLSSTPTSPTRADGGPSSPRRRSRRATGRCTPSRCGCATGSSGR